MTLVRVCGGHGALDLLAFKAILMRFFDAWYYVVHRVCLVELFIRLLMRWGRLLGVELGVVVWYIVHIYRLFQLLMQGVGWNLRHFLLREVLNTYLIRNLFLMLGAYIVITRLALFLHLLRRCDQILLCLALVRLRMGDLRRLFSLKQLLWVLIFLMSCLLHFIRRRGQRGKRPSRAMRYKLLWWFAWVVSTVFSCPSSVIDQILLLRRYEQWCAHFIDTLERNWRIFRDGSG